MNRNETFAMLDVASLAAKLAWATLDVTAEDVPDLQVLVSGDESEVESLRLTCTDGKLLLEQPAYGLPHTITGGHWMNIILRIPLEWKGEINLNTLQGRMNVRGLTGSDITLETASGALRAQQLQGITVTMATSGGRLSCEDIRCDDLTMRTITGDANIKALQVLHCTIHGVSSDWHLGFASPFDHLDAVTATGSLIIDAPITEACVSHKSVGGKLRTWGVSLQDVGAPISFSTVSGNLELNTTLS